MAGWVSVAVAVVFGALQVANLVLVLRIRNEVLAMRQDVLDRVADEYQRQDVCAAQMHGLIAE